MEQLKDLWHWIVFVFLTGGFVWQSKNSKKRMDDHEQLHRDEKFVTREEFERERISCQRLLCSEIKHVKEIATEIRDIQRRGEK